MTYCFKFYQSDCWTPLLLVLLHPFVVELFMFMSLQLFATISFSVNVTLNYKNHENL